MLPHQTPMKLIINKKIKITSLAFYAQESDDLMEKYVKETKYLLPRPPI